MTLEVSKVLKIQIVILSIVTLCSDMWTSTFRIQMLHLSSKWKW